MSNIDLKWTQKRNNNVSRLRRNLNYPDIHTLYDPSTMVTGLEIAHTTCSVLLNCVSTYKAINGAIKEFRDAHQDTQKLGEEIQIGVVRIQNIATILFQKGIIKKLKGANAECVLKTLKRLDDIL